MFTSNNKISKEKQLQQFLSCAKRNGYFNKIKQLKRNVSSKSDLESSYRRTAKQYYENAIRKPFYLVDQPEYKREKKFFTNFNAFVSGIPEFEKLPHEGKNLHTRQNNKMKQIFSETLICDPTINSEMSPENIQKRKQRNRTHQEEDISPQSNNFTQYNMTKIKIKEKKNKEKSQYPSKILFNEEKTPKSAIVRQVKSINKNFSVRKQISKTIITDRSKILPVLNQKTALDTLNKLTGSQQKKKNFRISKTTFHQLLKKKYGNEIISTFFQLQAIQDFEGISKIIKQIMNSSVKLAQLLTFLTFDFNQDGIITQDQLTKLHDMIPVESSINADINTLVLYCKNNRDIQYEIDLPQNFIKFPNYKEYLKVNSINKNSQGSKIRGVKRFFNFQPEQEEDSGIKYAEKVLPFIRNTEFLKKKQVRVNFENFQKAFQNKKPQFINHLIQYLVGEQTEQIDSIDLTPKKNISKVPELNLKSPNSKFLQTYNEQNIQTKQKYGEARKFLMTMKKQKKQFATIPYI